MNPRVNHMTQPTAEDEANPVKKTKMNPRANQLRRTMPTYYNFKLKQLLDDEPTGFLSSSREDFQRHSYSHDSLFVAAIHQHKISLFLTDKKSPTSYSTPKRPACLGALFPDSQRESFWYGCDFCNDVPTNKNDSRFSYKQPFAITRPPCHSPPPFS